MSDPVAELLKLADQYYQRPQLPTPEERRRLRTDAGLSLRAVADALGVAHQTIMDWEKGRYEPDKGHLSAYAGLLSKLAKGEKR